MDVVLQGSNEYDDRNGMNDDDDAANAGDECPGGGAVVVNGKPARQRVHDRALVRPVASDTLAAAGRRRQCSGEGDAAGGRDGRTCRQREGIAATIESVVPRQFMFTRRPIAPWPPRASPRPHRPCAVGRLPAHNKAIKQDGQHVVGRRRTPASSPL